MNDIRGANKLPEFHIAGPADHAKRKRAVLVIAGGSLRHQGDVELRKALGITQFGKPTRQAQDHRFDSTNAGRKKVRIEKQPHFASSSGTPLTLDADCSLPFRLRCTAVSTAPTQQSRNSSLVHDSIWRRTPSFNSRNFCGSAKTFFRIPASALMSPEG